jgi:hypothetical protein
MEAEKNGAPGGRSEEEKKEEQKGKKKKKRKGMRDTDQTCGKAGSRRTRRGDVSQTGPM